MTTSRFARLGAVAAIATLALAGCAANEIQPADSAAPTNDTATNEPTGATLSGTLSATGASSQTAAQGVWVVGFQTQHADVSINYEPTGSGVGRENFTTGAANANFIGSDRAFKIDEISKIATTQCTTGEIVEIPAYISPVAIAFNLEGVETLNLDATTIANIFAGNITNWNDPAIAEQNAGVTLPDLAITAVHRSDKSGTTGTFTAYLAATAPDVWTWEDDDVWPIENGEAADKTQGVASAISGGNGTIGYLDASQIPQGAGQVHVKSGESYVAYTAEAAAQLVEASPLEEGRTAADVVFDVDPAAAPDGAYPIALVSYLVGCVDYADKNTAQLVKEYFSYVVSEEGQTAAAEAAGSAPISAGLREKVQAAIDAIVTE